MNKQVLKYAILVLGAIPAALIVWALVLGAQDPSDPTAIELRQIAYTFIGVLFLLLGAQMFFVGKKPAALLALLVGALLFFDPLYHLARSRLPGQSFFSGIF